MRPLNKRQLLAQKWMFKTESIFLPTWMERHIRLDNFVSAVAFNWPCWLLKGHYAIADQCMKPEHDYCAWCQKPMPNQGERTPA